MSSYLLLLSHCTIMRSKFFTPNSRTSVLLCRKTIPLLSRSLLTWVYISPLNRNHSYAIPTFGSYPFPSTQPNFFSNIEHNHIWPHSLFGKFITSRTYYFFNFLSRKPLRYDLRTCKPLYLFVAVMSADPALGQKLLCYLCSSWESSTDISAQIPWVVHPIKAVQKCSKR